MPLIVRITLIGLFSIVAFAIRLLPHAPNMTPIGALALVAGALMSRRWAMVVPMVVLLASDILIGGYETMVMVSVYLSFGAIACIGAWFRSSSMVTKMLALPIISSTLFFFVTNAAVWAATPWYTKDLAGLLESYTLALPFWRSMLVGDILWSAAFFGAVAAVSLTLPWMTTSKNLPSASSGILH